MSLLYWVCPSAKNYLCAMGQTLLEQELQQLNGVTLQELDAVKLQNRVDSKFVFPESILPTVLQEVKDHYNVLALGDIRSNLYNSLYYDTPNDGFFLAHHNGKLNRYKVRYRQYMDSGLCFLEVKFKNNKGRTVKGRMKVDGIPTELNDEAKAFIAKHMGKEANLVPKIWNSFLRITMAHKRLPERLTIDHNLAFGLDGEEMKMAGIAIAELKQERLDNSTDFVRVMRRNGARPAGMSKYCIGSLLLRPSLKHNNFKGKLLRLNKLSNGLVPARY